MPVRLKDIAAAAGCSVASVSMALRGDQRISHALRERVQVAAKQLGYRRDPLLASMARIARERSRRRVHLGLVIDQVRPVVEHGSVYVRSLESVDLRIIASVESPERHSDLDGMLCYLNAPVTVTDPWREWLQHPIPAVAMGPFAGHSGLDRVRLDYRQAVHDAFERLWQAGFRRIGFCLRIEHPFSEDAEDRLAGYALRRYLDERPVLPPCVAEGDPVEVIGPWLKAHRPDAVIYWWPGLEGWFREHGCLGMPVPYTRPNYPDIGCYTDDQSKCRIAIDWLLQKIADGDNALPLLPSLRLVPMIWRAR